MGPDEKDSTAGPNFHRQKVDLLLQKAPILSLSSNHLAWLGGSDKASRVSHRLTSTRLRGDTARKARS
jgi:hypothetical protein